MATDLEHYPSVWARRADLIVHIAGLTLALFGGGLALGLAVSNGMLGKVAAVSIYALGLIAMLAFSLAYNFAKPSWQPFLRRLDHAGIFLMIAASYTPFTTQALTGAWSIGMTTAVWSLAALGIAGKMFLPGLGKAIWVFLYLALGWMVVIA
ncbi:hemolysin III family protein, partial [Aquidulcibacter sp.]